MVRHTFCVSVHTLSCLSWVWLWLFCVFCVGVGASLFHVCDGFWLGLPMHTNLCLLGVGTVNFLVVMQHATCADVMHMYTCRQSCELFIWFVEWFFLGVATALWVFCVLCCFCAESCECRALFIGFGALQSLHELFSSCAQQSMCVRAWCFKFVPVLLCCVFHVCQCEFGFPIDSNLRLVGIGTVLC